MSEQRELSKLRGGLAGLTSARQACKLLPEPGSRRTNHFFQRYIKASSIGPMLGPPPSAGDHETPGASFIKYPFDGIHESAVEHSSAIDLNTAR